MSQTILYLLLEATFATLFMVFTASLIATLFGLPLGVLLYITRKNNILERPYLNHFLSILINITRSIPFIILMIAVIPLTRFLVGTSIGMQAAIIPLSLAAIPFVARIVESALLETNKGLIEAALAMGATPMQIVYKILLPESLPGINLLGYSAMAGAVGGGGLGDLAIRYGYQRFDLGIMLMTIAIMIVLVQFTQYSGDKLAKLLSHCRN
jgi:D-methionine transport system permease protein